MGKIKVIGQNMSIAIAQAGLFSRLQFFHIEMQQSFGCPYLFSA